jgi:hypothetical protein
MNSVKASALCRHFDGTAMLFNHDVVAHGQAEAGAFAGRFCREERVEDLLSGCA